MIVNSSETTNIAHSIFKYMITFILGAVLCGIYNRNKIAKNVFALNVKNKRYLLWAFGVVVALFIFWLVLEFNQNGIVNRTILSANEKILFFSNNPRYLYMIPYNRELIVYFIMAFLGYSFFRITRIK